MSLENTFLAGRSFKDVIQINQSRKIEIEAVTALVGIFVYAGDTGTARDIKLYGEY